MAVEAWHNLMNILNDILDLSRMEAGHMEVFEEVYSPRDLMASVRARRQGKRPGTCLVTQAVPEVLLGDVVRLRQILFTPLANAIKFTPSGRVSPEANRARVHRGLDARTMRGDEERLFNDGFDGYLSNHLDLNRFMAIQEDFLKH